MSRLIESIRLKDGKINRLDIHQQRMTRSFREVFGVENKWNLSAELAEQVLPEMGLHKIRVVYDAKELRVECIPYTIKTVASLKLVVDNNILYDHKFEDRKALEQLLLQKGECDDILIVKQNRVTDSSYANIVFYTGDRWITPASCLLPGTMRQSLLETGTVNLEEIVVNDIKKFKYFKLINALLDWESPTLDVSNIR